MAPHGRTCCECWRFRFVPEMRAKSEQYLALFTNTAILQLTYWPTKNLLSTSRTFAGRCRNRNLGSQSEEEIKNFGWNFSSICRFFFVIFEVLIKKYEQNRFSLCDDNKIQKRGKYVKQLQPMNTRRMSTGTGFTILIGWWWMLRIGNGATWLGFLKKLYKTYGELL